MTGGKLRTVLDRFADLPARIGRPPTRVAYIPQIDGLRCLAILLVLVWHASLRASRHVDELNHADNAISNFYGLFPHGEIGVDLFFFVSALVIAQPFLTRPGKSWNIRQFYVRRVRRLYPPYLVAICICFFILGVIGHKPENANSFGSDIPLMEDFFASIFYLHSILFDNSSRLNPPMWSLEIEVQFYIISPLLLLLYMKINSRMSRVYIFIIVTIFFILLTSIIQIFYKFDPRFRLGLLAHAHFFFAGIIASDILTAGRNLTLPKFKLLMFDIFLAAGFAGFAASGLWLTQVDARPSGGWPSFLANASVLVSITGIYCGAMYGQIGRKTFELPWVNLIGTMCYSIYLIHIVVMQGLSEMLLKFLPFHNPVLIWGAAFLILLPAAFMTSLVFYIFVERPFMVQQQAPLNPAMGQTRSTFNFKPLIRRLRAMFR